MFSGGKGRNWLFGVGLLGFVFLAALGLWYYRTVSNSSEFTEFFLKETKDWSAYLEESGTEDLENRIEIIELKSKALQQKIENTDLKGIDKNNKGTMIDYLLMMESLTKELSDFLVWQQASTDSLGIMESMATSFVSRTDTLAILNQNLLQLEKNRDEVLSVKSSDKLKERSGKISSDHDKITLIYARFIKAFEANNIFEISAIVSESEAITSNLKKQLDIQSLRESDLESSFLELRSLRSNLEESR